MPGTPEVSRRSSQRYCHGEGHLELASSNSIGFVVDLEHVRKKVAREAFTPEQGVAFMHGQEPISRLQKEQLLGCLSNIATGNCAIYPIIEN